jgi:hypothetical protein
MNGYFTKEQRTLLHMSSILDLPANIQHILETYSTSLDSQSASVLARCVLDMVDPDNSEATWLIPDARIASIVCLGLAMVNPTITIDVVDTSVLESDTSSDEEEEQEDEFLLQRSQSCAAVVPTNVRQPKSIIAKWDPKQMPK